MGERRIELEIPAELMEAEWTTNKVVIRNMTGRIGNRVRDESNGKEGIAGALTLLYTIESAPWQTNNKDVLLDLDIRLYTWLAENVRDFNSLAEEKKKGTEEGVVREDNTTE